MRSCAMSAKTQQSLAFRHARLIQCVFGRTYFNNGLFAIVVIVRSLAIVVVVRSLAIKVIVRSLTIRVVVRSLTTRVIVRSLAIVVVVRSLAIVVVAPSGCMHTHADLEFSHFLYIYSQCNVFIHFPSCS